jgi:hypothetical protein
VNTGPFDFRTQINHLNTRLVWYSDGDCIKMFGIQIPIVLSAENNSPSAKDISIRGKEDLPLVQL